MCLLALVGIVLFSSLGVWQVHRSSEKKLILAREAAESVRAPQLWLGEEKEVEPFKRITFAGKFLPQVLFLDNQYHEHHIGYHVLSPVLMPTGRVVLVDRGWVPAGRTRQDLPDIRVPDKILDLSGTFYMPAKKTWVLGSGLEQKQGNQVVVEALDFDLMGQFLHKSIYPFIIRLDKNSAAGYVRDWVTVVMPAVRHLGYAFQWFSLAAVVLVVFIGLNSRRKLETHE
ncbi:MAG: SURF1 family protein [Gammaproteobacteria bacterium]|nr:SURF1 family protein [Gammaproteobacteria bacterium]